MTLWWTFFRFVFVLFEVFSSQSREKAGQPLWSISFVEFVRVAYQQDD